MNSTPVILHNVSGARVIADVRVPKGTRHISIIPVDPAVLANCALLTPAEHPAFDLENPPDRTRDELIDDSPFVRILDELDAWVCDHDDCPGLATLLDWIDRAGIGHQFDLKFWLDRWQRA